MKKIKITSKTRNTRALRNKIYRKALEILIEASRPMGICYAITMSTSHSNPRFYSYNNNTKNYPEISKYKPPMIYNNGYWWTLEDKKIRIKVLKQAIKKTNKV